MIFSHDPVRGGKQKWTKTQRRRRRTTTTTNKSGKQKQGTLLTCGVLKQTPPAPESAKLKHLEASDLLGGHSQALGSMDLMKGGCQISGAWRGGGGVHCGGGGQKKNWTFFFRPPPKRVFFSPRVFLFFSLFFFFFNFF
jgi:hypothetical protein